MLKFKIEIKFFLNFKAYSDIIIDKDFQNV
jgi:hypothetical protein